MMHLEPERLPTYKQDQESSELAPFSFFRHNKVGDWFRGQE